ncbi:MAG: tRNA (adenosine(37)-N6)-dimethylallyltransferase MiaA [Chloroflexi bacterium]|nr:tRNA (adenosine(37)-N6)-dimethylallyltransferase MiaA [Chloroflexota bacterium]
MSTARPGDSEHEPPPQCGGALPAARQLVAIVGPTATGKSALAVRLAEQLRGEVVNADSRQVYRGMEIGTAKPTAEERARVRHHIIDVAVPNETFSLGRYLDLAHAALDGCWSREVLPILAGGTGQYVWALLEGWHVPRVPPDAGLRAELEAQAERDGPQALIEELGRVDPAYAARVDSNNVRRVIRALEVYRRTGRPISACQTRQPLDCVSVVVGLSCPRDELYRRIDARVDAMIERGLIDEVRGLVEGGYACDLPAMSGIGYRQVCQHFAGELSLDEAIARIKTATHRLARTQHNWFRRDDSRIHWIDVSEDEPLEEALRVVESKLKLSKGGRT